ncbi:MAG: sulfur transport protein with DUF4341 domain [Bacteroidetes bacterium HLUCCA01]|nr:MAG: sulfur transport protein with DUF4341 domain [Bacteroidetes bacterium HLUCCA01]
MSTPKPYMNPYFAGFLLGCVLLGAFYISGRGLGASGGMRALVVAGVETVAPAHAESAPFYVEQRAANPESPLRGWLFFHMLGLLAGAFLSGVVGNRVDFKLERGPNITVRSRMIFVVLGGLLFGFGSQLGRGCTSGSALSGMASLSFGGIITMLAIFGGAYIMAYFFRKLWL